ncbi:hypothetical protein EBU58_12790, partial [bacterium]|nr:hypothetical protein [bacterium]
MVCPANCDSCRTVTTSREFSGTIIGRSGKARLFDGRSGEPYPTPISVGYMYILKLHHLV